MTYTLDKINDDGSVTVTFTSTTVTVPADRKTQNLANITTKDQLDKYARDFEAGLMLEQAQATAPADPYSDLSSIVGKKQTVSDTVEG